MFLPSYLREKTSFEDILRPAPIEAREAIRAIKDRERLWELYETRIWPAWIVDRPTCHFVPSSHRSREHQEN